MLGHLQLRGLVYGSYSLMTVRLLQLLCKVSPSTNCLDNQIRLYARKPFPSKVAHYLYRAKLIDDIRLSLRSNPSTSLSHLLNDRLLDSFVVTHALRSAPSADSALLMLETLEKVPNFSQTATTIHSLAKVLAKFGRRGELKSLIDAINAGRFRNVHVSPMNLIQWYATSEDLDSVLQVWDEYRKSGKPLCTESYNIVMQLYAQEGRDSDAVQMFRRMINEGAIPNCRTYTIIIEHLANAGKIKSALEVFNNLPKMRMKRTLKQYSVLVEGLVRNKHYEDAKTLLHDMQVDGILPGRAMRFSLQHLRDAGFVNETDEFIREMLPDERIESIGCVEDESDEDEDVEEDSINDSGVEVQIVNGVQLKPWLDPRALASALNHWSPEEASALENSKLVWTTRLVCKVLRSFRSPESAWEFFRWVAYRPGFTHDIYTVQRMMALFARHGCAELVEKLTAKVRSEGMRLPFSTIRLIIEFYGFSKNADGALKFFHDHKVLCGHISNFNLMILYSSLLRTLTKCGRDSEALNLLDEMILSGVCPDIQTFSGLMHYFAVQGDIKTVQRLFTMVRQSAVEPDAYMFKLLIQAYCKCDRAALAWRVFEDMKNFNLMPDVCTKDLLVKSLWKEGKRREAAAVEESCEGTLDVLPLMLSGHIWTVSSADLMRVHNAYADSLLSNATRLVNVSGSH